MRKVCRATIQKEKAEAERIDALWERTEKLSRIIGWAVLAFTPIWWIIKAM